MLKNLLIIVLSAGALALLIPTASAGAASAPKLLKTLAVSAEQRSGYDRKLFPHWLTVPGTGCTSRQVVLGRQNQVYRGNCRATTGRWVSAFDRQVLTASRSLDVDHFVPLAEAWDSGARRWSAARRSAYANDLYGYSLLAVSASSNRSKGDSDPQEWLPPAKGFRCRYLARWVAIKYRWRLSVDRGEKRAIVSNWKKCPKGQLKVTKIARARVK
jgi:hypothetical protein